MQNQLAINTQEPNCFEEGSPSIPPKGFCIWNQATEAVAGKPSPRSGPASCDSSPEIAQSLNVMSGDSSA